MLFTLLITVCLSNDPECLHTETSAYTDLTMLECNSESYQMMNQQKDLSIVNAVCQPQIEREDQENNQNVIDK